MGRQRSRRQPKAAKSANVAPVMTTSVATPASKIPEWDAWTPQQIQSIDAVIKQAQPIAVTQAFTRISSNFTKMRWLDPKHVVGRDPRSTNTKAPLSGADANSIAEFTAASVPLHMADAWTYFGRALSALASGSIEIAQHLLYYSELRAMYALLFRHGVVLLNGNLIVGANGTIPVPFPKNADGRQFGRNEHQAVWVLFRHWTKTREAAEFCGSIISLRGTALADWISERPQVGSLSGIIAPLMEQWGIDVARFSDDRELRNKLSYSPTGLSGAEAGMSPARVAALFSQVWGLLEPEERNIFENLDGYIARDAFDALKKQDPKERSYTPPSGYASMNEYWVTKVLGASAGGSVVEFLGKSTTELAPAVLANAGQALSHKTLPDQLTGMVGRALILLRFATGATQDLLQDAGCKSPSVEFWLDELLTHHGIRLPEGSPKEYLDLYPLVDDLLTELGELDLSEEPSDIAVITEIHAKEFQLLSGFERVPAWAVG